MIYDIKIQTVSNFKSKSKVVSFLSKSLLPVWIYREVIKIGTTVCERETTALVFSCEYFKIFNTSVFYKTPPVAASGKPRHLIKAIDILKKLFGTQTYRTCNITKQVTKSLSKLPRRNIIIIKRDASVT